MPRAGLGFGLAGGGDGRVAVLTHLLLVVPDGGEQVAAALGQRAAQQGGVLQRRVGSRTSGRAHRVDGIAEYGDPARRPRRHRPRGTDPDQERIVDGGRREQRPQVRVPGPGQLGGQRVQFGRRHRGQTFVRDPEVPAVGGQRPHQVVLGGGELESRLFRPLAEADQPGGQANLAADHGGEARLQRGRQPVRDIGPKRGLAVDAPLAGIDRLGGGQVLPAHRRVDPVRADQQVRLGLPPVGEMQPHAVLPAQPHAVLPVVPDQFGAEDQPVAQPGGQHLPQGLAVDRGGQGGGRVRVGRGAVPALLVQDAQPLAQHRQPRARVTAGGLERREGFRRQAVLERPPGPGVDVQPVALPPDG